MQEMASVSTILIIAAVLLFFLLGVALVVIVDHKSKLPSGSTNELFSIKGMHEDHPALSFLTGTILLSIIGVLLFELSVAFSGSMGLFQEKEAPKLLTKLGEHREQEQARHFHNAPEVEASLLGKKNVCFYCHGDFPHSKEPMVRTLLNMHSQFVGCLTCHVDARKVPEKSLTKRWLNFSGIEVTGPPFGTDSDPDTGFLIDTDDLYSKIVVYSDYNGVEELLEITEDDTRTIEFAEVRDQLSDQDREAIKKSFHKLVSPKGRFCSRCHTAEKDSYIPFRELGFSERRISAVTNLNIVGLVQKYKTFYIPSLLKTDKSLPSMDVLTGKDQPLQKDSDELRKDPRAWWRETFAEPKERVDEER